VVHSDRIIKFPWASELPMGVEGTKMIRSRESPSVDVTPRTDDEYVIDKIVDHGVDEDGLMRVKVRWYGFTEKEDTWEPVANLPRHFLRLYARRVKIPVRSLI
jgi:Chromo (CHRromatin Organisation MOdifier) domain